MLGKVKQLIMR